MNTPPLLSPPTHPVGPSDVRDSDSFVRSTAVWTRTVEAVPAFDDGFVVDWQLGLTAGEQW